MLFCNSGPGRACPCCYAPLSTSYCVIENPALNCQYVREPRGCIWGSGAALVTCLALPCPANPSARARRLLGASVGRRVFIGGLATTCHDALALGDLTSSGSESFAYCIDGDGLVRPVRVDAMATLGNSAVLFPGSHMMEVRREAPHAAWHSLLMGSYEAHGLHDGLT